MPAEMVQAGRELFLVKAEKHGKLAMCAANPLRPVWPRPRAKVARSNDALDRAKNLPRAITAEIGVAGRDFADIWSAALRPRRRSAAR